MLGAIILGPDKDLADLLYRRSTEFPDLSVYKIIHEYPKLHHIMRLLNAYSPERLTGVEPAVTLPEVPLEKKEASNVKEFFASNLRGLLRKRAS